MNSRDGRPPIDEGAHVKPTPTQKALLDALSNSTAEFVTVEELMRILDRVPERIYQASPRAVYRSIYDLRRLSDGLFTIETVTRLSHGRPVSSGYRIVHKEGS